MRLLLDTCVWFNFLENEKGLEVLYSIKKLLDEGQLDLVVPDQITTEIERNLERLLNSRKNAMRTYRKHANNLKRVLSEEKTQLLDEVLNEADSNIPKLKLECDKIYAIVQAVLNHPRANHLVSTVDIKAKAAERGLSKIAPFNKGTKNSMGDAVILETVLEFQRFNPNDTLYFVSLNSSDFSDPKEVNKPHAEISDDFSALHIVYSISPGDTIEAIGNITFSDEAKRSFYVDSDNKYIQIWCEEFPKECCECGGALTGNGYRIMFGCAGHMLSCRKCGFMHHVIDSDY